MWRRLQWGFITALGYIIASWLFTLLIGKSPNLNMIAGLALGGFVGGITYLNPPPKKWRENNPPPS